MSDIPNEFVCGFAKDGPWVYLVEKNRPKWQAGKLNGIGGHMQEGETPEEAIRREFKEEAGVFLDGWEKFLEYHYPGGAVHFFRLFLKKDEAQQIKTQTDEKIVRVGVDELQELETIPNLRWIIPMAFDKNAPKGSVQETL